MDVTYSIATKLAYDYRAPIGVCEYIGLIDICN